MGVLMRQSLVRLLSALAFVLLLADAPAPLHAGRLFFQSISTAADPQDLRASIIHRELPRQALLVAAIEEMGIAAVDPSFEPEAQPAAGDISVGLTRKILFPRLFIEIMTGHGNLARARAAYESEFVALNCHA